MCGQVQRITGGRVKDGNGRGTTRSGRESTLVGVGVIARGLGDHRRVHARDTSELRAPLVDESAHSDAVLRRSARSRRSLAVADVVSAAVALVVSVQILGHDNGLRPGAALAALPLVVSLAKLAGLYDRDELVLDKTTLDEAPQLFQLATLFALLRLARLSASSSTGTLGRDQVLGAVGACCSLCSSLGRPHRAPGVARRAARPSAACSSATPHARRRVAAEARRARGAQRRAVGRLPSDAASDGARRCSATLRGLEPSSSEHDVASRDRRAEHGPTPSEMLDPSARRRRSACSVSVLPRMLRGRRLLGRVRRPRRHARCSASAASASRRSSRVVKRALRPRRRAPVLLLVARAAPGRDRAGDQARLARARCSSASAASAATASVFEILKFRTMVAGAEAHEGRAARRCNEAGRPVQDRRRPAHHARRAAPAPHLARRAAAAVQRPARRDEPRRPAAAGRRRGRPHRGLRPPPAAPHARA